MEIPQIYCDVCGRAKAETNHWFVAVSNPKHVKGIAFGPSDALFSPEFTSEHICGQECLHKRLSQWLEFNSKQAEQKEERPDDCEGI